MKIADLYAALGFKVEGADELKSFETSLVNIANAAKEAAAALKNLTAGTNIKAIKIQVASAGSVTKSEVVKTQTVSDTMTEESVGGYGPEGKKDRPLKTKAPPMGSQILKELSGIRNIFRNLFGFGAIFALLKGLMSSIIGQTKATMQSALSMDRFAKQTGIPLRELRKWEMVGAKGGLGKGEIPELMSAIRQTAMRVVKNQDTEATVAFNRLGLNMFARPDEILKSFMAKTGGMGLAQAQSWGADIGISPDQVYALRENLKSIDDLLPGMELSDQEQASVLSLNQAWQEMIVTMDMLKDKILADFAPLLQSSAGSVSGMSSWLTTSKEARANFLGSMLPGGMMGVLWGSMSREPVMIHNVNNIEGVKNAQEVKQEVSKGIRDAIRDANYQRAPAGSVR